MKKPEDFQFIIGDNNQSHKVAFHQNSMWVDIVNSNQHSLAWFYFFHKAIHIYSLFCLSVENLWFAL